MAIVLYGKDGARQIIKGHVNFEAFEKNGWYRNPDEIPDEPENSEEDEKLSSDDIRLKAEEAGIEGWDTKRIKTLKKELDIA